MPRTNSYKIIDPAINMEIKEQAASYKNSRNWQQPLISELRAIRGKCDELKAKRIAKNANLPLKWFDKAPE